MIYVEVCNEGITPHESASNERNHDEQMSSETVNPVHFFRWRKAPIIKN